MHDPLDPRDVVTDELTQRLQTGYDIAVTAERIAAAPDHAALEDLYVELITSTRRPDWPYLEPNELSEIQASSPAGPPPAAAGAGPSASYDRVLGGWLGRIAGCNLGKPFEEGDHWTPDRIRRYLELADAYPLRDYAPAIEPAPDGFRLRECWTETTRGRVRGSARDDDIDYPILAVQLLEQHGRSLTPAHSATAWLSNLPFLKVFTAERAVYVNLLHGIPAGHAAEVRNPYREWIGALIRADAYGWVLPGRPHDAAALAYADGSLSHRGNGLYGAMWAAAMVSIAGVATTIGEVFDQALDHLPRRCRLREALLEVRRLHSAGTTWDDLITVLRRRYRGYSWVHTINNACVIAAGLLWGNGDYASTVGLTVQGGWDTDSNAATAGSVVGTMIGAARLPDHFVQPLEDRTRSAVFGCDNSRISDLAQRTVAVASVLHGR